MRIVCCTGGGGAGVTTLAAASAAFAASLGLRTHLIGADLEAIDAVCRGADAALTASTADVDAIAGVHAPDVRRWLGAVLSWAGLDDELAGDAILLPGLAALAALLAATTDGGERDLTVVDLGSLAEALPVLHLVSSDPAGWRAGEAMAGSLAARLARPLIARLTEAPQPNAGVRQTGEGLGARLRQLRSCLHRPEAITLRVMLPADGRRARTEREALTVAGLHGIALDAIVTRSGEGRAEMASGGARLVLPRTESRPADFPAYAALGKALYGSVTPDALLAPARGPRFELTERGADLVAPVPRRPETEFAVMRRGGRLSLRAGPWRRVFPLPAEIAAMHGRRAWHDGEVFRVRFER